MMKKQTTNFGLAMRQALFGVCSALVLATSLACPPSENNDAGSNPDAGDDAGTVTPPVDSGVEDSGVNPPVDGGGGGNLDLGAACQYGTDACGSGKVCTSIFASQNGNQVDTSNATCYASCDTVGQACSAALGLQGVCAAAPDGTSGNICIVRSANLGPCGNGANAACTDTVLCVQAPDSTVGLCATACDPANPTTCTAIPDNLAPQNDGCGCPETLQCSRDVQLGGANGQGGDGVCAPPTNVGDACGIDPATQLVDPCTGDQRCVAPQGQATGTCQIPADADAGQ